MHVHPESLYDGQSLRKSAVFAYLLVPVDACLKLPLEVHLFGHGAEGYGRTVLVF